MEDKKHVFGDSAALSAAVIAGAIAVFMTPGPYNFLSGVLGLTLFFVVWSYEYEKLRTRFQSFAFSSVITFTLMLVIGLFLEMIYGGGLPRGISHHLKGSISAIPDYMIAAAWAIITPLIFIYDRKKLQKNLLQQMSK